MKRSSRKNTKSKNWVFLQSKVAPLLAVFLIVSCNGVDGGFTVECREFDFDLDEGIH